MAPQLSKPSFSATFPASGSSNVDVLVILRFVINNPAADTEVEL